MSKKLVSIIIRTFNEERYLEELLKKISIQRQLSYEYEVVIVDSGSTDRTLDIAKQYSCKITSILKDEFTFGRSLNIGCEFSSGSFLIFISGHCIPEDHNWIEKLISPLESHCSYVYGRQIGRDTTKFSERQLFDKYYPKKSQIPQEGFFCNNANAAIRREIWETYKFDENLTGCEDMYLAKMLVHDGLKIGYVADAAVYHIHDESWEKVKIRYEREAYALQKIMPEIQISIFETIFFICVAIFKDLIAAFKKRALVKEFNSIVRFRFAQYIGSYAGNKQNRSLSYKNKLKYFYPRVTKMDIRNDE